jgi:hypothetical protein
MAGLHQTMRLSAGRHRHPREGACAMELASLLGGEPFTDHPARVCAVLAAFLRGYNDATSAGRRQDLYALAAAVVDSRVADPAVRRERAEALLAHTVDAWCSRGRRFAFPPEIPSRAGYADLEAAGAYVGRLARRDGALHARTTALVAGLARREANAAADAPDTARLPLPRPLAGAGVAAG